MKPLSKIALLAAALGMAIAVPAFAQDGPIASARTVDVDAQIRDYLDHPPADLPSAPETAAPTDAAPVRDNAPHGEVGVGIGTWGYRHVHASTVVPVGTIGTAAIAVSDTRFNGRRGPQKIQSLSIGVALGDASAPAPAPDALCADALGRRADRDPMWVTRMRAGQVAPGAACRPESQR